MTQRSTGSPLDFNPGRMTAFSDHCLAAHARAHHIGTGNALNGGAS